MELIKTWYKNLSVYSAIGMAITFLTVGDFIQLNFFLKLVLLGSTITTIIFIVTRIIKFKKLDVL